MSMSECPDSSVCLHGGAPADTTRAASLLDKICAAVVHMLAVSGDACMLMSHTKGMLLITCWIKGCQLLPPRGHLQAPDV